MYFNKGLLCFTSQLSFCSAIIFCFFLAPSWSQNASLVITDESSFSTFWKFNTTGIGLLEDITSNELPSLPSDGTGNWYFNSTSSSRFYDFRVVFTPSIHFCGYTNLHISLKYWSRLTAANLGPVTVSEFKPIPASNGNGTDWSRINAIIDLSRTEVSSSSL
jgi:hypothetical protein